ncbi:hypothetical protein FRC02_000787, partial [Tulasnella sp. 418]
KSLPSKDRIKWWNIVPGDKVRVVRGPYKDSKIVREVLSVDKTRNQVFLKGLVAAHTNNPDKQAITKHVHYSNLQLYVGQFAFPPKEGSEEPETKDVWATRLSTSSPYFHKARGAWIWNRYASSTRPSLPGVSQDNKIQIPWPLGEKKTPPKAGLYDTSPEDVLAVTWTPFNPGDPVSFDSLHDQYLRSLHPGKFGLSAAEEDVKYDESSPMERYLEFELSNPHSRAKKQARWQEKMEAIRNLKETFVHSEIERARMTGPGSELGGRRVTAAEAATIGEWKWKHEVARLEKKEKYRRWVNRGGLEGERRVKLRAARKVKKIQERLSKLTFTSEKNQVLPSSLQ